jgi:hypothetical protein
MQPRPPTFTSALLGIFLGSCASAAVWGLHCVVPAGWPSVSAGIAAIVLLGVSLFWFREHYRLVYGVVELAAAVGLASRGLIGEPPFSEAGLFIAASAYTVVRACDNISKAIEHAHEPATALPDVPRLFGAWARALLRRAVDAARGRGRGRRRGKGR